MKKRLVCSTCGEKKPIEQFYRDWQSRTGRQRRCKTCSKDYHNERYAKLKASGRKTLRDWPSGRLPDPEPETTPEIMLDADF